MQIINIIDRIDYVNFGIWNAALFTSKVLKEKYGVTSQALFPKIDNMPDLEAFNTAFPIPLDDLSLDSANKIIDNLELKPEDTIIVTHGVWRYPTKWGNYFAQKGFKWIYTPHGMLEPWGMQSKRLKKFVYFNMFEKKFVKLAANIRAVSSVEQKNLSKDFDRSKIILIPNGTQKVLSDAQKFAQKPYTFLFLGRLNYKKSVLELVKAWKLSKLSNNPDFKLMVCGPDDGEVDKLHNFLDSNPVKNLDLVGHSIIDNVKDKVLSDADFFILPSKSEGFPTSVVEAGMYGLIPVVSDGCNFPELFQNKLGIHISSDVNGIVTVLDNIADNISKNGVLEYSSQSQRLKEFFLSNYTTEKIADMQYELYKSLL